MGGFEVMLGVGGGGIRIIIRKQDDVTAIYSSVQTSSVMIKNMNVHPIHAFIIGS